MKDFRQITFETLFEEGLTSLKEKDFNISSLSENQNLRANQLFNNTKITVRELKIQSELILIIGVTKE